MKILLTGSGGFIGSCLASSLQDCGNEVIGSVRNKLPVNCNYPIVVTDLSQGVSIDEPVDIIIHVAAQSPAPGVTNESYVQSNVDATRNLIRYAREFGVSKFIYFSSISIYGDIRQKVIDEDTPIINPGSYGLTKYLGELLLKDKGDCLSTVVLRLPGVLGKGAQTPWLVKIAQQLRCDQPVEIYNPQSEFNNMVHVFDLDNLIKHLLKADWHGFEVLNLGCREPMSVMDTVQYLKNNIQSNSPVLVKEEVASSFTISIEKAVQKGYLPKTAKEILDVYSRESVGTIRYTV